MDSSVHRISMGPLAVSFAKDSSNHSLTAVWCCYSFFVGSGWMRISLRGLLSKVDSSSAQGTYTQPMSCNVASMFDCLIPSSMISSGRCLSLHLPCVWWCIATCVNDELVCAPSSMILPGQAALLHLSCVWSCSDAYVHDERKVPTDEETDMQTFGIYRKQLSEQKQNSC